MFIYLCLATLLFWGAWSRKPRTVWKCALLFLWFFIAFRGIDISGSDWVVYKNFYDNAVPTLFEFPWNVFSYGKTYLGSFGFGWGFALLCSVAKTFGPFEFFQVYYVSILFIVLAIITKELPLNDTNKCIFLFGYLTQQLLWYFGVLLRQSLSNLIIWYLIVHEFKSHKLIKRAFLLLIAYSIHSSVLPVTIFMLLWGLIRRIKETVVTGFALAFGMVMYFFGEKLIQPLINIMVTYVDDRYAMYIDSSRGSNLINFIFRGAMLILIWYQYKKLPPENRKKTLDASAICFMIGSVGHELAVRMLEYFMVSNYYGLGLSINAFTPRGRNIARILVYLAMMTIFVRFFYVNGTMFRPYYFFF